MSEDYNNVRIFQQEDLRWTLAWEDAEGLTQTRTDFESAGEATAERDKLLGYAREKAAGGE